MKGKIFFILFLIIFVPSAAIADSPAKIKTGYDLYMQLINFGDLEELSHEEFMDFLFANGLFFGAIDGIRFMNLYIQKVLDSVDNKEAKRTKTWINSMDLKYMKINRGQMVMIYNKWASDNPKELQKSYQQCIYNAFSK